jgi:hypothetical protein
VDRLKPEAQGELALHKDGAHPDRERLMAGMTVAQSAVCGLALRAADLGLVVILATRANGPSGQNWVSTYSKGSRIFVVEAIGEKNRSVQGLSPNGSNISYGDVKRASP